MRLGAEMRRGFLALLFVGLAACSPGGSGPVSLATSSPLPASTIATAAPADKGKTYGSLTLSASPYTHPSNSFTLDPPDGWEADVHDTGVTWKDPGGNGRIEVRVTMTGYPLGGIYLDNFIQAIGEKLLEDHPDYRVLDRSVSDVGAIVLTQSLTEGGESYQVISVYDQRQDVVYDSQYWVRASSSDEYMPAYEQIWRGMTFSPEQASSSIEPYAEVYTFRDAGGLFSLDVPRGWQLDVYTQPDAVADTFWSPDRLARIEVIQYDDGTEISKALAGSFALDLLHQRYSEGAKITEDKVLSGGAGERLTWSSKGGAVAGASVFETRGTTFLMVTALCDDTVDYVYSTVLGRLLESYRVP
jgi:hypothetical protein